MYRATHRDGGGAERESRREKEHGRRSREKGREAERDALLRTEQMMALWGRWQRVTHG